VQEALQAMPTSTAQFRSKATKCCSARYIAIDNNGFGRMNRTTLMMGMSLLYLTGAALPPTGPVPDRRPETAQTDAAPSKPPLKTDPSSADTPAQKDQAPKTEGQDKETASPSSSTNPPDPATVPTPEKKPQDEQSRDDKKADSKQNESGTSDQKPPASEPAEPPPPPIMTEDPQAYSQCLKELSAAGVQFVEKPRIDDSDGCGIDKPIEVSTILPGVTLSPKATLRCEAALELSKWVQAAVIPAAEQAIPDKGKLTAVNQASSYICRKRNSKTTGKISEHARGNAIDIGALTFEKGKVDMTIAEEKNPTIEGAFQRTLNASACLYFTTVLAPGSDETHMDHMHLDLIKRNNDARYCRDPKE
jgi:hypothetical protein